MPSPYEAWNGRSISGTGRLQDAPPSSEYVCITSVRSPPFVAMSWSYHTTCARCVDGSTVTHGYHWARSAPGLLSMSCRDPNVAPLPICTAMSPVPAALVAS